MHTYHLTSFAPRWRRFAILGLIVTLLVSGLTQPTLAAPPESRVLPQLQREAGARPQDTFRVIIARINKDKDKGKANDGDRATERAGGKKVRNLSHDAFVAELPGKAIRALGQNPNIKYISYDAVTVSTCIGCAAVDASRLATQFPQTINATALWPATVNGTGWTGKGVGVAVLDTGTNGARADWNSATGTSRIVANAHFSSRIEKREDGHGHGTHVSGIILGNAWQRSETTFKGKYVGVAPEANLIDVKVSDDKGRSYISDVVDAIDWVVTNRATYNIRVMNLSLVSSVAESARTSVLAAAVERAWFNGILVVVAAGNAGPNTLRYPPANDPFVITVGASDTMNTPLVRSDDGMAPWSSYGVSQDGVSKPDVVAPGRSIIAPLTSSTSTLGVEFASRIVDDHYIWMSGTSMAAPVVAGIGALAFQAHPEWTNDHVKWLLMNTGTRLTDPSAPLISQGAGLVNAAAVVNYPGSPLLANQGVKPNEQLIGPAGTLVYDSSSWSSSSWSSSSWSSSSWSSSSWSSSSWSSSNESSSTDDNDCTIEACTDATSLDVE